MNNFDKRIRIWQNTLNNKQKVLQNIFGIILVMAFLVFIAVFTFSSYKVKDAMLVSLIFYSVIGCYPYIEVAKLKNDGNSFFPRRLTISNWKNEIKKNEKYDILSSNTHILNSVFPVLAILSIIMFFIYKIFGEDYVTYKTVLILLLIQVPFNSVFGLNPLGVSLARQSVSKHISQNDLKRYLNRNSSLSNKQGAVLNNRSIPKTYSIAAKPELTTRNQVSSAGSKPTLNLPQLTRPPGPLPIPFPLEQPPRKSTSNVSS